MFDNVFVIFGAVIVLGCICAKVFPRLFPEPKTAGMRRSDIYRVIDGERAYQATQWKNRGARQDNPNYRDDDQHSIADWLGFMKPYQEAAEAAANAGEAQVALHNVRKIMALGVACCEQHGCPGRAV